MGDCLSIPINASAGSEVLLGAQKLFLVQSRYIENQDGELAIPAYLITRTRALANARNSTPIT